MTKITQLAPAVLPLAATDLIEVVQDVSTTPISRKVEKSALGGGGAPVLSRQLSVASEPSIAPGALVTIVDVVVTPPVSGYAGRLVDAWFYARLLGPNTNAVAGNLQAYDVEGAGLLGEVRWHNQSVSRFLDVAVYGKLWVPAGTTRTLRVRCSSDSGSGQTVTPKEPRLNLTYSDLP